MLTSVVFGQSEDDSIFYDLYWIKTDTLADKTLKVGRYIEGDPTPDFFIKENIDTLPRTRNLSLYFNGGSPYFFKFFTFQYSPLSVSYLLFISIFQNHPSSII